MKKTYEFRAKRENLTLKVKVNSSKNETHLVDIHTFDTRGEQVGRETFGVGDRFTKRVTYSTLITWETISRISSNNVYFRDFAGKEMSVPMDAFAEHNYQGFNKDRIDEHNALHTVKVPIPPGYWDAPNL